MGGGTLKTAPVPVASHLCLPPCYSSRRPEETQTEREGLLEDEFHAEGARRNRGKRERKKEENRT